jgi:hypothetical protein
MKRLSVVLIVVIVMSALLTACGGGSATADPAAVVKNAMQAVVDKKFDLLADLTCAAKRDEIKNAFNPAGALAQTGMDPQKILEAMSFKLENGDFSKVSETGDKAVVQMKGKMTISVDKEKFKVLIAEVAKAQGQELPVDQLDQVIDMVVGQLAEGTDIDQQVDVIKENGKWVMCPSN